MFRRRILCCAAILVASGMLLTHRASLAVEAQPPKAPTTPSVPAEPKGTFSLPVFGAADFGWLLFNSASSTEGQPAKKYRTQIHRDHTAGNTVYMTEMGTLAVADGPKNFDLKSLILKSGSLILIRYSPYSGVAWKTSWNQGENRHQWSRLTDGEEPGWGDYDVQLVPKNDDVFLAFRIDRRTGRTWSLEGGAWVLASEPK
jgi:hypothetical protein